VLIASGIEPCPSLCIATLLVLDASLRGSQDDHRNDGGPDSDRRPTKYLLGDLYLDWIGVRPFALARDQSSQAAASTTWRHAFPEDMRRTVSGTFRPTSVTVARGAA
jgi:hypothetical protein